MQAALGSRSWGEDVPGGFALTLAASCSCSRGSAPSAARGALRTEPPLRMSTYAEDGWILFLAGIGEA